MNYALKWLPSPEYFSSNLESLFGFAKVNYKCVRTLSWVETMREFPISVYDNFNSECEPARESSYQHVALVSFALASIHCIHLSLKTSPEQF